MIRSRADGERFIPTMSCALTRLLRSTCGGRCTRTAIFVTLSRALRDKRVTIHTLQVAHCMAVVPRPLPTTRDDSTVHHDDGGAPKTPSIVERFASLLASSGRVTGGGAVPLLTAPPGSDGLKSGAARSGSPTASPTMLPRDLARGWARDVYVSGGLTWGLILDGHGCLPSRPPAVLWCCRGCW